MPTSSPSSKLPRPPPRAYSRAPSPPSSNNKPRPCPIPNPVRAANSSVPSSTSHDPSTASAVRSPTPNRSATARPVVGIFFPLRPSLRLSGHRYTPDLLCRLVTLAGKLPSAECVATAVSTLAVATLSGRHVQRLTQEVGTDLAHLRDAQAVQQRRRQLEPRVAEPPPVAVVEVDGGRLGTREPGVGPGVQQPQPKEDKIAFLLSMQSAVHAADPQPEPPAAFRDHPRVARLVRQIKAQSAPPAHEAAEAELTELLAAEPLPADQRRAQPKRLVRTCVASMSCSAAFGPLVAAEAQTRAFFDAPRQAFVGDGQQYNWSIQRAYFPHFEPIADFLHVLCYLYPAAWAVQPAAAAHGQQYETWMTACWQGRVGEVVAELAVWQERLGRPPPDAAALEPRQLVQEALTYLRNNAARMDYPRYRRQGLPVTSSWVESLVGEFNARVKGWDKWWNRGEGVEAMLQVRAAVLSEDDRLARYFAERPGHPYRRHRHARLSKRSGG